jgi:tryptophan 2,3-dioxygenase
MRHHHSTSERSDFEMMTLGHDGPDSTVAEPRPASAHTPLATYWDYIKVESLLSLQGGLETDERALTNDEVMFIVIHQVDELWFKLALRELTTARDLLVSPYVGERILVQIVRALRRVNVLFRNVTQHFELMETLTTHGYLGFRDKLAPASGYQSGQLRELEVLIGLSDGDRIACGHEGSYMRALRNPDGTEGPAYRRVQARLRDEPTLEAALTQWIFQTPIDGSVPATPSDGPTVAAFLERYLAAYARDRRASAARTKMRAPSAADVQRIDARLARDIESAAAFLRADDAPAGERDRVARARAALVLIESDVDGPLSASAREVIDAIVAFEQAFVIFRQRHARMVERIIGRRAGTGGTAGVEYLDQTALRYRVFKDIAAVRTILLRDVPPPPKNASHEGPAENK